MKTRVTKGWKHFGTNEQDAYTPAERSKYDRYCLNLLRKTKRWTGEELQKFVDEAHEEAVARRNSYNEAKAKGILRTKNKIK